MLKTERLIEAPNWTPDGLALIVNCDGRLYRVALASPDLIEIDTGFAKALNNDHGVPADGETLVISDRTESGLSQIYTLRITGGAPQKVTEKAPSYWHGWSPDGTTLAYVGRRDGLFQVLTCPVEGGKETHLASGFDHCDGPDYSNDGKYL